MKVAQSCPTLCDPMDYTVRGILQARILEGVGFPFSRGSSQPRSPALWVDSLQLSHKGSQRILEWVAYPFSRIFLIQESNWGLLNCSRILYQLSYQGRYLGGNINWVLGNVITGIDFLLVLYGICSETIFPSCDNFKYHIFVLPRKIVSLYYILGTRKLKQHHS